MITQAENGLSGIINRAIHYPLIVPVRHPGKTTQKRQSKSFVQIFYHLFINHPQNISTKCHETNGATPIKPVKIKTDLGFRVEFLDQQEESQHGKQENLHGFHDMLPRIGMVGSVKGQQFVKP